MLPFYLLVLFLFIGSMVMVATKNIVRLNKQLK